MNILRDSRKQDTEMCKQTSSECDGVQMELRRYFAARLRKWPQLMHHSAAGTL